MIKKVSEPVSYSEHNILQKSMLVISLSIVTFAVCFNTRHCMLCNKNTGQLVHCDNLAFTFSSSGQLQQVPPDHVINMLEEMTSLCHYCLLDSGQQEVSLGQSLAAVTNNLINDTSTNLLTNLLHVFTPTTGSRVSHCNNAVQCNAMQCNAMQCNAMQCNAMQCNAMQCNAMQCNAIIR